MKAEPKEQPADGNAVPSEAGGSRNPLLANAENITKLGAATLGVLYVLGLLISNLQLMDLGIAEFGGLNSRNVMTGALFVIWLSLFLVCFAPLAVAGYAIKTFVLPKFTTGRAVVTSLVGVLFAAALTFSLVSGVGAFIGYMIPWGMKWTDPSFQEIVAITGFAEYFATMTRNWLRNMEMLRQFAEAYLRPKTLLAIAFLAGGLYGVWMMQFVKDLRLGLFSQDAWATIMRWMGTLQRVFLPVWVGVFALLLLVIDFAYEVYPDIRYNLGGGQPQIAEMELADSSDRVVHLFAAEPCRTPADAAACTVSTGPIAIWHQSAEFVYVTRITPDNHRDGPLLALETGLVKAMKFIPERYLAPPVPRAEPAETRAPPAPK